MKKQYITPQSETISFATESLMTTMSISATDKQTLGGSKSWSTQRGWDSSMWDGLSDSEEEE